MDVITIKNAFEKQFDLVGIIKTKRYLSEANQLNLKVPLVDYPTMVVLGLSYPMRIIKQTATHLVPSFYTFGSDYHGVLKNRIDKVMSQFNIAYMSGVDNHPHHERLAATLSNLGYFAKNQLIINKTYGSYIFLGLVFLNIDITDEIILENLDDCGTCRACIDACPTKALSETAYDMKRCISYYNQEKSILTDEQIQANYALFGCDICQMVCPKNINIQKKLHQEFELSGKEMVSIVDLFTLSEKEFKKTYEDMAYLWKGKTILMRNALMLMNRKKNQAYIDLIEKSLIKHKTDWYQDMAKKVLKNLKNET